VDGMDLGAWGDGLGDLAFGVAGFDDVAGEEAEQSVGAIDDGEGAEGEALYIDELEDIADELIGGDLDRFLEEAVDVVFDAADFGELLFIGEVIMDEPEAPVEGHGDGHSGFGDRVHIGGHDRDIEAQILCEDGIELGIAREDL